MTQAQTGGPWVVLLVGAVGVLWRAHIRDQKTILEMTRTQGEAMVATAVAMEKLSTTIRENRGAR